MKKLIFLLALCLPSLAMAQSLTIQKIEMDGENINVYYDLADTISYRTYTISLYSSKDDFVAPLKQVSGDVGIEVEPGRKKKIVWRAKSELGSSFNSKVTLELKGRLYVPFVRMDKIYSLVKRAKKYKYTWTGGTTQNVLNFDLMKGEQKIEAFPNIANVGHTQFTISSSVKPGTGYYFRITDSKNKDQIVNTKPFTIKRKIPLVVKAAVLAVVGTAAYIIINTKGPEPVDPNIKGGEGGELDPDILLPGGG